MSKLQKKPSALKRGHPTLQNMNFYKFFLLLWVIFALLDPDPDPGFRIPDPDPLARLNPDPIRIRIRNPEKNGAHPQHNIINYLYKKVYIVGIYLFFIINNAFHLRFLCRTPKQQQRSPDLQGKHIW
jgi:hypothetical protein